MQYQETNKHWGEFSSIVHLLLESGRRDSVVIALMATESFFRPILHRILEGLYWFVMDIFFLEKAKYISMGISQVQVRHWHTAGIISCSTSRVAKLIKFYNPLLNYDACKSFVDIADIRYEQTEIILHKYTGKTTRYHFSIFEHFLNRSLKICSNQNVCPNKAIQPGRTIKRRAC